MWSKRRITIGRYIVLIYVVVMSSLAMNQVFIWREVSGLPDWLDYIFFAIQIFMTLFTGNVLRVVEKKGD